MWYAVLYQIGATKMMLVQEYLLTHSLNDLARDHGVYARLSTKNLKKFSLNYDQIEARESDPVSQECRGLVLASDVPVASLDAVVGSTKVYARPMRRFFNHGQAAAADVNFDGHNTHFLEKLDGTLCIVYRDPDLREWCVATRSVPDADLAMDGYGDKTFSLLFWEAFRKTTNQRIPLFRENLTFCFELCTPENQIVVRYDDYKVYLLAVVRDDGYEYNPDKYATLFGVPMPQTYALSSVSELVDFVSGRDPKMYEGVVVCDRSSSGFKRVKVKSAGYLALNKIKDNAMKSPRGLVELMLLDKLDDAMPLFPEHIQAKAVALQDNFREYLGSYLFLYDACVTEADKFCSRSDDPKGHRKAFALAVQARKQDKSCGQSGSGMKFGAWMGPMMDQYQGKSTGLVDWLRSKRQADGGWANGLLDQVLGQIS